MLGLVTHAGAGWKVQMEHHQAVPLDQLSGARHVDHLLAQPGQHAAPAWQHVVHEVLNHWSLVKLHLGEPGHVGDLGLLAELFLRVPISTKRV